MSNACTAHASRLFKACAMRVTLVQSMCLPSHTHRVRTACNHACLRHVQHNVQRHVSEMLQKCCNRVLSRSGHLTRGQFCLGDTRTSMAEGWMLEQGGVAVLRWRSTRCLACRSTISVHRTFYPPIPTFHRPDSRPCQPHRMFYRAFCRTFHQTF